MTEVQHAKDVLVLSVALILALIGVVYSWKAPGECVCDKCGFHRNERLSKRRPLRTQEEMQHEVQHRGFGFAESDPDVMDCRDHGCLRNTGHRRIGP